MARRFEDFEEQNAEFEREIKARTRRIACLVVQARKKRGMSVQNLIEELKNNGVHTTKSKIQRLENPPENTRIDEALVRGIVKLGIIQHLDGTPYTYAELWNFKSDRWDTTFEVDLTQEEIVDGATFFLHLWERYRLSLLLKASVEGMGITPKQLAEKTGIPYMAIASMYAGNLTILGLDVAEKLSKYVLKVKKWNYADEIPVSVEVVKDETYFGAVVELLDVLRSREYICQLDNLRHVID